MKPWKVSEMRWKNCDARPKRKMPNRFRIYQLAHLSECYSYTYIGWQKSKIWVFNRDIVGMNDCKIFCRPNNNFFEGIPCRKYIIIYYMKSKNALLDFFVQIYVLKTTSRYRNNFVMKKFAWHNLFFFFKICANVRMHGEKNEKVWK